MNNSPFEIFRRNLKPLMVLLTGLALFAFVVLPVVNSYMRRNSGSGGDRVIAKFDGKSLTQNRVDYFTRNHHDTVGFLAKLADDTLERGGIPKTAGFQYDPQSKQVLRLGINQTPGAEVSIRTMMFAEEARKAGFELDDNAIQSWLDRFTDGMVSDADITGLLMSQTQNRMGRPHLYEQLRNHLLADVYLKRGYAGLYSGDNPSAGALLTPSEQWKAFEKLNRSATVDAYGVLVNDYLDQTDPNPPEELIRATYEEGKDRDVNDQSPDPAFHRRYTASFEYLAGDLNKFIDEEVAKLKEEDIRAEYEKRLAGGEFQLPDENLEKVFNDGDSDAESKSESESDDSDKPTEPDADSTEEASKTEPDSTPVLEDVKGDETEAEPASEDKAEPTEEPKAETTEEPKAEQPSEEAADSPETDPEETAGEEDSARIDDLRVERLVALQEEGDEATDEPAQAEESGQGESKLALTNPQLTNPQPTNPQPTKPIHRNRRILSLLTKRVTMSPLRIRATSLQMRPRRLAMLRTSPIQNRPLTPRQR